MAEIPDRPLRIRFGMLARLLATADAEADMIAGDPVLRQALVNEGRIGRRIVTIGRDTAMIVIALFLPFISGGWDFLYYEALLLLFWLSGRQQVRLARVGRSFGELAFILFDILLLTFIAVLPNPFSQAEVPTAFGFRFQTFDYLFLVLAFATLAYSWRTVWSIGVTVAVVWLAGAGLVALLGYNVPLIAETAATTAAGLNNPRLAAFLDLNNVQWNLRVQEVVVFMLVAGALTLKGWRSNQLLIRQARLAEERANLSRYFSPTIVDRLASQPAALREPQTPEVAVMFTDLVGFTDLAERLPDAEVLPLLRRYYAEIERVVFDEGGTLDKYLGDGVMATFGTPVPEPGNAAAAIRAARRIVEAIDAVGGGLHVSVGVHFGRATVGDVGPARRLEFAVIGDTVNVASRLEAATREIDARIVISDALVARARAEGATDQTLAGFTALPALALRGRRAPVDVWVFRG
jgi:adenylate cyclase